MLTTGDRILALAVIIVILVLLFSCLPSRTGNSSAPEPTTTSTSVSIDPVLGVFFSHHYPTSLKLRGVVEYPPAVAIATAIAGRHQKTSILKSCF